MNENKLDEMQPTGRYVSRKDNIKSGGRCVCVCVCMCAGGGGHLMNHALYPTIYSFLTSTGGKDVLGLMCFMSLAGRPVSIHYRNVRE